MIGMNPFWRAVKGLGGASAAALPLVWNTGIGEAGVTYDQANARARVGDSNKLAWSLGPKLSGKWYAEVKLDGARNNYAKVAVGKAGGYTSSGGVAGSNAVTEPNSYQHGGSGSSVGVMLDLDTGFVTFRYLDVPQSPQSLAGVSAPAGFVIVTWQGYGNSLDQYATLNQTNVYATPAGYQNWTYEA